MCRIAPKRRRNFFIAGKKTGKRLLTWVLVLVMALSLLPLNALAAGGPETDGSSGMNFTKKLVSDVPDKDGNYTIQMTAQATGTTTTTTEVKPMDIVLVLDQSGSMADDFNGNYTSNNEARRQYAMKAAVNSFIGEVAAKYSDDADHRMAIVTFGDEADTLVDWTAVNRTGEATLTAAINDLPENPSGATNVGAGMQKAQALMNNSEAGTDRLKTVIVFTDGVPTKQRDFDTTVADAAIAAAKGMKNDDVTIYTVGIFNGANTKQLYGKNKTIIFGIDLGECSGEKNDYWQYRKGVFSGGDIEEADIAAGNRFLNYLSSNYDASSIGVSRSEFISIGAYYYRFDITDDPAKGSDQGYYKKASDASSLKNIFKVLSDKVPAPGNPALDEKTVITDTLSDYFTFATGTTDDVKVYTKKGDVLTDITDKVPHSCDPQAKTVTVTGYDFSAHHTTSNDPEELVIEIKVKPSGEGCREEEIPTNADTAENHAAKVEVKSEDGTKTTPVTSHETAKVTGHKVFYNPDNDTGNITGDGLYYPQGAAVPVTNIEPTLEGHEFTGWTSDIEGDNNVYTSNGTNSITMPAADVTLTAQWTPNSGTKYTVKHYQQNLDDDNSYTLVDTELDKTGTTGEQTTATAKDYEGFIAKSFDQQTIAADGSTVVEIRYDRNTYTVTYTDGVNNETIFEKEVHQNVKYGAPVPAYNNGTDPSRKNYTFTGWDPAVPATMPANDLTFTAKWEKNNIPTYKFDLSNQNIIKVNKKFVSMYGLGAEKSFTATATIEKQDDLIVDLGPNPPSLMLPTTAAQSPVNIPIRRSAR